MKKSKTMQIVMIRAGAEARRNKLSEPGVEQIYLAILKISQMSSERIAPSSSERGAIDAEIAELKKIFEEAGVDAESAYERLLATPVKTGSAMEEERRTAAHALLERAEQKSDEELTTPAVLRAILEQPASTVQMANGKGDMPPIAGEIDDDDETMPGVMPQPRQEQGRKEMLKKTTAKKEGVDLGAILLELQRRRENGGTAPEEPEPEEAPPEKRKPAPEPEPEPAKPEPEKPEPPKKKPGEGIDLVAIMRELRERRESGESDDDEPETKPDPKRPAPKAASAPVKSTGSQTIPKKQSGTQGTAPKKTPVKAEPKRDVSPPPKTEPPKMTTPPVADEPKKTEFLGATYSGGLGYAVTIYIIGVVVTVGLFWGLSLLLKRFYHPANMDPSTYGWFFLVVYMTGAYFLLRVIPGLFWQRFKPFSLFLDGLLFSAYMVVAASTFLNTVEIQSKNGDIYLKILAGIFVLGALIRANGKIRMLPDTCGITKETQYWFSKLTGSPDKIFYSGALITLFLPVIAGTVYWVLGMQPHKSFLIYLFVAGWFLLVFLPQSQTLWYSEYEYGNSRVQKKRKAACEGWMMQMILLFPIGLMLFLSYLYGWFPLPIWEIVLLSFFALTYVIGTISTIINNRK